MVFLVGNWSTKTPRIPNAQNPWCQLLIWWVLINITIIEGINHFDPKQYLKGAGGSSTWRRSKSSFLLFLTERSVSYQMLFTGSKNIVPTRSYQILNPKNAGNYLRVFPKMDIFGISKSIYSYIFWDKCMKPGSYVLGSKTELLI